MAESDLNFQNWHTMLEIKNGKRTHKFQSKCLIMGIHQEQKTTQHLYKTAFWGPLENSKFKNCKRSFIPYTLPPPVRYEKMIYTYRHTKRGITVCM